MRTDAIFLEFRNGSDISNVSNCLKMTILEIIYEASRNLSISSGEGGFELRLPKGAFARLPLKLCEKAIRPHLHATNEIVINCPTGSVRVLPPPEVAALLA